MGILISGLLSLPPASSSKTRLAGPAVSRPQASPPPARRPETSPAEEVLSKVDQLSDEEVDTLLQEMIEEEVH